MIRVSDSKIDEFVERFNVLGVEALAMHGRPMTVEAALKQWIATSKLAADMLRELDCDILPVRKS